MVIVYPTVPFDPVSRDYMVFADGQQVPALPVRVSAMQTNMPYQKRQRDPRETELAAMALFEGDGPVDMEVRVSFDIFRARVLPQREPIEVRAGDRSAFFRLPGPGSYVLEINGVHMPLHIFFNPPQTDVPDRNDPSVVWFEPGLHNVGTLRLQSGQTLYISAGARVLGQLEIKDAQNVRVCGRGILDLRNVARRGATQMSYTQITRSRDVRFEGIVLEDSPCFSLSVIRSENVTVENIKIIGQWRYNSDGIDVFNSANVRVRDCFIRSFDDSLCVKGNSDFGDRVYDDAPPCRDICFERCVVWNDWGRALEVGADLDAQEVRGIVYRDIDVLHFSFIACDVQMMYGAALVHDVLFEDIRIGEPLDPQTEPRLAEVFQQVIRTRVRTVCPQDALPVARGITFRNLTYRGRTVAPVRFIGQSDRYDVRNIRLENILVNGSALDEHGLALCPVIVNNFAREIYVDQKPLSARAMRESPEDTRRSFLVGNNIISNYDMDGGEECP